MYVARMWPSSLQQIALQSIASLHINKRGCNEKKVRLQALSKSDKKLQQQFPTMIQGAKREQEANNGGKYNSNGRGRSIGLEYRIYFGEVVRRNLFPDLPDAKLADCILTVPSSITQWKQKQHQAWQEANPKQVCVFFHPSCSRHHQHTYTLTQQKRKRNAQPGDVIDLRGSNDIAEMDHQARSCVCAISTIW